MKTKEKQFTLIELIIVIVTIGLLAGMALPKFIGTVKDAKVAAMNQDLDVLEKAVQLYESNNDGGYPFAKDGSGNYTKVSITKQTLKDVLNSIGDDESQVYTLDMNSLKPYLERLKYTDPTTDTYLYSTKTNVAINEQGKIDSSGITHHILNGLTTTSSTEDADFVPWQYKVDSLNTYTDNIPYFGATDDGGCYVLVDEDSNSSWGDKIKVSNFNFTKLNKNGVVMKKVSIQNAITKETTNTITVYGTDKIIVINKNTGNIIENYDYSTNALTTFDENATQLETKTLTSNESMVFAIDEGSIAIYNSNTSETNVYDYSLNLKSLYVDSFCPYMIFDNGTYLTFDGYDYAVYDKDNNNKGDIWVNTTYTDKVYRFAVKDNKLYLFGPRVNSNVSNNSDYCDICANDGTISNDITTDFILSSELTSKITLDNDTNEMTELKLYDNGNNLLYTLNDINLINLNIPFIENNNDLNESVIMNTNYTNPIAIESKDKSQYFILTTDQYYDSLGAIRYKGAIENILKDGSHKPIDSNTNKFTSLKELGVIGTVDKVYNSDNKYYTTILTTDGNIFYNEGQSNFKQLSGLTGTIDKIYSDGYITTISNTNGDVFHSEYGSDFIQEGGLTGTIDKLYTGGGYTTIITKEGNVFISQYGNNFTKLSGLTGSIDKVSINEEYRVITNTNNEIFYSHDAEYFKKLSGFTGTIDKVYNSGYYTTIITTDGNVFHNSGESNFTKVLGLSGTIDKVYSDGDNTTIITTDGNVFYSMNGFGFGKLSGLSGSISTIDSDGTNITITTTNGDIYQSSYGSNFTKTN